MLQRVNPKRRWLLAIVTLVVVAGVVGFVLLRNDPKDDLPRLGILRQEHQNGQKVVVFRLEARKRRALTSVDLTTLSPSTGSERAIEPAWTNDVSVLERGSTEIRVIPPVDEVWRLRCYVEVVDEGMKKVVERLKLCWSWKSLEGLFWQGRFSTTVVVESELITNTVPRTADTPAR